MLNHRLNDTLTLVTYFTAFILTSMQSIAIIYMADYVIVLIVMYLWAIKSTIS